MTCNHKFEKFNSDLWWCPHCNKIFEAEEIIKYYEYLGNGVEKCWRVLRPYITNEQMSKELDEAIQYVISDLFKSIGVLSSNQCKGCANSNTYSYAHSPAGVSLGSGYMEEWDCAAKDDPKMIECDGYYVCPCFKPNPKESDVREMMQYDK